MSETKKERKKRTPRNGETIFRGVMNLPLIEKVKLCRLLKEDIQKAGDLAAQVAKQASELITGI
jgi:hypothetical protein